VHAQQPIRLIPTSGGLRPPGLPGVPSPVTPPSLQRTAPVVSEEPLALVDEDPAPTATTTTEPPKSKIHAMSSVAPLAQHSYKRPTHYNKTGAVRMRTFHCRLSEQGVEYLDQVVNDWLESHPDIEVKFTNSTIGLWDGKLKEPTLILNVWY
jgi:hypothetical protein